MSSKLCVSCKQRKAFKSICVTVLLFVWESRLQNVVVVYFRRIGICGSGTLTYSLVVTCSLSALRNVCQSCLGLNPCNFLNAKLVDILFWSIYIQVEVTLSPIWKTTDDD